MISVKGRGAYLEQIHEYREKLYQFRDENSVQALKQLLELVILNGDVERRKCTPDALPALQGETYAYSTILNWITQPPNRIPKGDAS